MLSSNSGGQDARAPIRKTAFSFIINHFFGKDYKKLEPNKYSANNFA